MVFAKTMGRLARILASMLVMGLVVACQVLGMLAFTPTRHMHTGGGSADPHAMHGAVVRFFTGSPAREMSGKRIHRFEETVFATGSSFCLVMAWVRRRKPIYARRRAHHSHPLRAAWVQGLAALRLGRQQRVARKPVLLPRAAAIRTVNDLGWAEEHLAVENMREHLQKALDRGGMGGKALVANKKFPTKAEVMAKIPPDCFVKDTRTSLMYAASSVGQVAVTAALAWHFIPFTAQAWLLWVLYALVQGTFATGAWVIAHECGHDAFCNEKWLQTSVGYFLHSVMLAPYYSWQRSHAVHHAKTNHVTQGETHVPKVGSKPRTWEKLSKFIGFRTPIAVVRMAVRLVLGWPAYLLFGASGGPAYGKTSHMWPYKPFNKGEKELFPGKYKEKVLKADIGIIATCVALWFWASKLGWGSVVVMYGGPLLVANAWLVLYTWLQHTDVDVPQFDTDTWTWGRGAFMTVDRPYGKVFDFLHHRIGSTHVAHHVNCTIPHYKAVKATEALKEHFPDVYLYDPTPVPLALFRVVKNCFRVQRVPGPDGMHVFTSIA